MSSRGEFDEDRTRRKVGPVGTAGQLLGPISASLVRPGELYLLVTAWMRACRRREAFVRAGTAVVNGHLVVQPVDPPLAGAA
jgi:hypothetical protein